MRCPICDQKTLSEGNPYRPFCSERCKLIDLHNWLSSRYRISTPVESREKAEGALGVDETAQRDLPGERSASEDIE